MPVKYTNVEGISLPMAIWLLNDTYDHKIDPNYRSATELLKPMQEQVLKKRNQANKDTVVIDIAGLAASQDGTAMHDAIEASWKNKRAVAQAGELLGISEEMVNAITINPTDLDIKAAKKGKRLLIPVYMEQRSTRDLLGFIIGGKFDLILAGELHDYKKTGTFTYTQQSNAKKYVQQGSIYRWLNPDKVTNDTLTINYYFTDWSKFKTADPKYPPHKIMTQHFKMMSLEETEKFISDILKQLLYYKDNPTANPPDCTQEELWMKPPEYKYYSNPTNTRASKNFGTDSGAAHAHARKQGKGLVKEIPSMAKACKYCSQFAHCPQAVKLLKNNQLDIS